MYYLSRVKALPRLTSSYRVLKAMVRSFINFSIPILVSNILGLSLVAYLVLKILRTKHPETYINAISVIDPA